MYSLITGRNISRVSIEVTDEQMNITCTQRKDNRTKVRIRSCIYSYTPLVECDVS